MPSYRKSEAREWAKANLVGCSNVVIPSYTADLKALNEAGIRHDIRKVIEFGFSGTLLVSEVAITLEEYRQFFEWANDEAAGRIHLIHHAMFNTLAENIEAAKIAEENGAELVLLCYPVNFYAENDEDIYRYTKAFCDNTNLAVMLFQVPHWGFQRVHGSDIRASLLRRLIDDCPNLSAIKAEGGMPSIMGFVECHRLFGKEVVISNPLEKDMIPLAQLVPIQYSGTSNTEYFGATIPAIHKMLQDGKYDEATDLYWKINPARKANAAASASNAQTGVINRLQWKYQGWLAGMNGGPLRQPSARLLDVTAAQLRNGLVRSGLPVTEDHDRQFFIGRHPAPPASERPVAADGDAVHDAALGVVRDRVVLRHAVVPDGEIALPPAEADLELRHAGVLEQVAEHRVALLAGDAEEALGEALVDEQRLAAGDRMGAHDGMLCRW